jgi:MFS superfamily sulfate permease-like transporter
LFFDLEHEHKYLFLANHEYTVGPKFLVTLPDNFFAGITFPDFSQLLSFTSIKYIIMFSLVGTLESLLSGKAIDILDPFKRKSNLNRDLVGVGIGNTLAGLIGGLPMISEIVRSSANINNGAKTWWSNVFHGIFLLVFVAVFPFVLHQIPLTALAAMLIYTGFRLASPKEFFRTYLIGKEQFLVFTVTILVTVGVDLLVGILAGIITKWLIHIYYGLPFKYAFKPMLYVEHNEEENEYRIKVFYSAVFSNWIRFKSALDEIPRGKKIILDFENANIIDHTAVENIEQYKKEYEQSGGIFELCGLDNHRKLSSHHHATLVKNYVVHKN